MKAGQLGEPPSHPFSDEQFADVLHGLSQPLTTLECGLELAIGHDTTIAQVRCRLKVLLEAARALHQRLIELRALAVESSPVDRPELTEVELTLD